MSRLNVYREIKEAFDQIGEGLTQAGHTTSGVQAYAVSDFFSDLYSAGVDPEDLIDDQHEFARDVINVSFSSSTPQLLR